MTIEKAQSNGTLTVTLTGRLDTITSPDLEQALSDLVGVVHLALDFEKITYISSAGLRVLLALQKRMSKQGRPTKKDKRDLEGFMDI